MQRTICNSEGAWLSGSVSSCKFNVHGLEIETYIQKFIFELNAIFLSAAQIQGTQVIAKRTFTITQEAVDLDFEGYGIKLHVPESILPAEASETQLNVQVNLSGQLPSGSKLSVQSIGSPVPISLWSLSLLRYSTVLYLLMINSVHSLHSSTPCIPRRAFLTYSWSKTEESSLPIVHMAAYHYPTSLVLA